MGMVWRLGDCSVNMIMNLNIREANEFNIQLKNATDAAKTDITILNQGKKMSYLTGA